MEEKINGKRPRVSVSDALGDQTKNIIGHGLQETYLADQDRTENDGEIRSEQLRHDVPYFPESKRTREEQNTVLKSSS